MGRANRDSTANYKLKYQLAKTKQKAVVVMAQGLLQYCQLLENITAIFPGTFGILHGISKFLYIYSTSSRKNPADVLRNTS